MSGAASDPHHAVSMVGGRAASSSQAIQSSINMAHVIDFDKESGYFLIVLQDTY